MREVQISPQVAALIGTEEVARLASEAWDQPMPCWECSDRLATGDPVSVLLIVPSDLDAELAFIQHAHPACSASAVKRYTVAELQARSPEWVEGAADTDVDAVALVWETSTGSGYPALFLSYRAEVLSADTPERSDLLVSGLIREGWHLASTLDAPPPAGPAGARVRVALDPQGGVGEVELLAPDGAVDTVVTVAVPRLWYPALRASGQVAVFHGSQYLHQWQDRGLSVLAEAARAGTLVGGRVPALLDWSAG